MQTTQQILDTVLKRIKPSAREEGSVKNFVSDVLRVAKTVSGLDCVVVGSIGKFTWLSNDHDIDVFMLFPKETPREDLEKKGLEYGKKIVENLKGKAKVKYAEHPYTHAIIKGFDVDIVPCYRIQKGEHIQSAVDRSPLHLSYALDHMTPRMADEVRLLKQFCKAQDVYGSDEKHQGFSGYICELLIIYYQSFDAVVKAAAEWKAPQVVEVFGFTDKTKFPEQPLVITDPVDKNRNAAAVVSADNFIRFVSACKQFSAKPSANYFNFKPVNPMTPKQVKYLLNRGTRFFALSMNSPDVVEDVLYPQLRKARKRIENLLHHNEFSVLRSYEFVGKKAFIIFEIGTFVLPPVKIMEGPPVTSKNHTDDFLSKYKGKSFLYMSGNRWVAEVKREFKTPAELLEKFLRKEKASLVAEGVPTYIADVISKCSIMEQEKFFSFVKTDRCLSDFLRQKYFVDTGKGL
ncbi:CCA tRNA nucleotidyltransferase [archaeon]|nr:CCA tRNA nucleotidyltransferase [archaeon]